MDKKTPVNDIAVIGMSGRFPGARNVNQFWSNLCDGVESVTQFSQEEIDQYLNELDFVGAQLAKDESDHENYVRSGFVLDDIDMFDASFFGYNPSEAELIDPQQRLFLETAWHAFEDAGYNPEECEYPVGVFAGASMSQYYAVNIFSNRNIFHSERDLTALVGNEVDYLTTRVSYKLNLRGPSMSVQSACSSSMVAIHLACKSLQNYECKMALAGGSFLQMSQTKGYMYREGGLLSKDGHVRVFDAKASGTIFSNGGVAGVVLKRLEDAIKDGDHIYSIIKGTAVDNDGANKSAMTAPTVKGQMEVIRSALKEADVKPNQITYVEAHGTGTLKGDPIEVSSLSNIYGENNPQKNYCGIGSLKTNVGHLDRVAGVTGLIKASMCLENKLIPPTLNYEEPNPHIDFDNSPFFVNTRLREWDTDQLPRRVGVNSFGVGGTNAHAILEEAPSRLQLGTGRGYQLISLSARTKNALEAQTSNIIEYLENTPDANLADIAFTLHCGRKGFSHRRSIAADSVQNAIDVLRSDNPKQVFTGSTDNVDRDIVFMFSGQGSQYVNMGKGLYQNEVSFKETVDQCAEVLKEAAGFDIRDIILPENGKEQEASERLKQTSVTQPALFIIEYALAQLLISWGVRPDAMIGHSIGEYVAACLAGVFDVATAINLVAKRGELMQSMEEGDMLAVNLPEDKVKELIDDKLSIAAINSPNSCVISGLKKDVDSLEQALSATISCQRLHTSHAFHSFMMEPMLDEFINEVKKYNLNTPEISYQSNLTGNWVTDSQATDPEYWAQHIRNAVRFADGVKSIISEKDAVFLEVGPGHALTGLSRHSIGESKSIVIPTMHHPKDPQDAHSYLISSLGQLWNAGFGPDWKLFYPEQRCRLSLPKYPFERMRYWVEAKKEGDGKRLFKKRGLNDWFYLPHWKRSLSLLTNDEYKQEKRTVLFFATNDGSTSAITDSLEKDGNKVIRVLSGDMFNSENGQYRINPGESSHYEQLFDDLKKDNSLPDNIVHTWSISSSIDHMSSVAVEATKYSSDYYQESQNRGFYSLMYIAQAIGKNGIDKDISVTAISNGLHDVLGQEEIYPEKASILGACKVIPLEYSNIKCKSIDIVFGGVIEAAQSEFILNEIYADIEDSIVAYRNSHRWVQDYENIILDETQEQPSVLRDGGVYLITGGLGGIGLAMADYLADQINPKLVLIGRSKLPSESEWEDILLKGTATKSVKNKIESLMRLREKGAEIKVYSADVTDYGQMKAVIDDVHQCFGNIDGVIHSAGVSGGGMVQLKTHEMAEKVLQPKIKGCMILDDLLKADTIDMFILCSSLFSVVGGIGQIDYCAANSYMDAFAQKRNGRNGEVCISVNWDAWQDIGMAVNAMEHMQSVKQRQITGRETSHPLLGTCVKENDDLIVYSNDLNINEQWVLSEHKIMGSSIIPGTGYLELTRAAIVDAIGAKAVEIDNALFMAPLEVLENENKPYRLTLTKNGDFYDVNIESRPSGSKESDDVWMSHFTAKVREVPAKNDTVVNVGVLNKSNEKAVYDLKGKFPSVADDWNVEDLIHFGPRWININTVKVDDNTAFLDIEMDEVFESDLESYQMHPSLLDMATGPTIAPMLIGDTEWSGELYLPFSYKRLIWHKPLPRKLFSFISNMPNDNNSQETIVQDISIYDEQGQLLVEVEGFTLRKVHEGALKTQKQNKTANNTQSSEAGNSENNAMILGGEGIPPKEGIEAFSRILKYKEVSQVVVSTSELISLMDDIATISKSAVEDLTSAEDEKVLHQRPNISTEYVEPVTDLEKALASIWQNVLGIDKVGLHDNFFELGADSVLGIQVISKARGNNIVLNPNQLFEYQTIAELSKVAESDLSTEVADGAKEFALTLLQQQFTHNKHQGAQCYQVVFADLIDNDILYTAINEVTGRHEGLRMQLDKSESDPKIVIAEPYDVLGFTDLSDIDGFGESQRELLSIVEDVSAGGGHLVHYVVVESAKADTTKLFVIVNNLVADKQSIDIVINDLATAYQKLDDGEDIAWDSEVLSYGEYVDALNDMTDEEIASVINENHLSHIFDVANHQSQFNGSNEKGQYKQETYNLKTDQRLYRALKAEANKPYKTNTNELLLTALARALSNATGRQEHIINLNLDARACVNGSEYSIGQYDAQWPAAIQLDKAELDGQIRSIKDQVRGLNAQANKLIAYKYSDQSLTDEISIISNKGIGFHYSDSINTDNILIKNVLKVNSSQTDYPFIDCYCPINVYASFEDMGMQIEWRYLPELVDEKTIKDLAADFIRELSAVIDHCSVIEEVKYSTSDFPEASLAQNELDSLLEDIAD